MFRTTSLAAAALMLSGILNTTALAQFPQVQPVQQLQDPNRPLIEAYQVLESTKNVLLLANNDYGTHKNTAINAITAAQNRLLVAMGLRPTARAGKSTEQPGARPQPQAISDRQLANSINVLGATARYLQNGQGGFAGQKIAAVRDLQRAQQAIQRALRYSQGQRR